MYLDLFLVDVILFLCSFSHYFSTLLLEWLWLPSFSNTFFWLLLYISKHFSQIAYFWTSPFCHPSCYCCPLCLCVCSCMCTYFAVNSWPYFLTFFPLPCPFPFLLCCFPSGFLFFFLVYTISQAYLDSDFSEGFLGEVRTLLGNAKIGPFILLW